MKAYRDPKGEVLLFRPYENFLRMNRSAERMCMPQIPEEIFMNGLLELIRLDKNWVPSAEGCSLYIRPVFFATDEAIGVKPSENYKLVIFTSPSGIYFNEPLKVLIETGFSRSSEGGVGYAKAAGNYGGAMYPTRLAQQKGYNQVIWTDAVEHKYLEESGAMNLMFVIDGKLVTPSLSNSKLAGITRDSILTLAKSWGLTVEERNISIDEIQDASDKGVLEDAFGCGTAANIAPIATIGVNGRDLQLPALSTRKISQRIAKELSDIKTGRSADAFHWTVKI
jgi:branched-chain amino acid aminotransferase